MWGLTDSPQYILLSLTNTHIQESCPEAMVGGDWTADYSAVHYLEDLATTICPREPGKFRSVSIHVASVKLTFSAHPQCEPLVSRFSSKQTI